MAKVQEYRDQSVEQLEVVHEDLRKALFGLRNERRETGQVDKPHLLKTTRRDIARLLTVMNEKRKGK